MALLRCSNTLLRSIKLTPHSQALLPYQCSHHFFSSTSNPDDHEEGEHAQNKNKKESHEVSTNVTCAEDGSDSTTKTKKKNIKTEASLDPTDEEGGIKSKSKIKIKSKKKETDAATKDPDSLLVKSLKKQINEVTDLANKFQTEVRGSFKPFEVVPNEGSSDLTLRRIIGKEEVIVKCLLDLENPHLDDHGEDDSENENSDDDLKISQCLTLNVQISKDSSKEDQPRVAFLCSYAKGETIVIEDIAYLGTSIHDKFPYSGPCFQDLNDNLKQVFQSVLKARGINSSLAETIVEHLTNQYQDEYIGWLKKVRDFLVR